MDAADLEQSVGLWVANPSESFMFSFLTSFQQRGFQKTVAETLSLFSAKK
jgi:hypothetical protein